MLHRSQGSISLQRLQVRLSGENCKVYTDYGKPKVEIMLLFYSVHVHIIDTTMRSLRHGDYALKVTPVAETHFLYKVTPLEY
ncbi:hypothetical protein VNO77_06251 [Canavalia gladiata]|uniref:Uncharacterized protein n=1 Tax=Canavalia gladiata TaxID=3824 RepID=A0AAN9MA53_CANGL